MARPSGLPSTRNSNSSDLVEIQGLDDLDKLSKALKDFDTDLRKELHKTVRAAAKPLIPLSREAIREDFPQRGGLAEEMGKTRIRTAVKTGKNPGVSVVFTGITVKLAEGYGIIRHPAGRYPKGTPRRDKKWVEQKVPLKGALERVIRDNVHTVLPGITAAVERAAEKVIQKVRR